MNYKLIKQWKTKDGYDAVIIAASPTYPHYCGYVAIPEEHPKHGRFYDDCNVSVHGGLTYDSLDNQLATYPTVLSYNGHWFGFDAAHAGDKVDWELSEQLIETDEEKKTAETAKEIMKSLSFTGDEIRTLDYMIEECESLSRQLKEMEEPDE